MAAPAKQGLDYFPHDIGLLQDRKLRKLKLKYGFIATGVYLALLEIIYGDKGYYIAYAENKDDVIWQILEFLQGRFQPSAETVSDVIDGLVDVQLFSADCYPKIITSKRVQQTYYSATVDRKAVSIDFEIWLLSEEEMRALSSKSFILQEFVNRANNGVNRANNGVNRAIYSQSKVKESKVNISLSYPPTPLQGGENEYSDDLQAFLKKYPNIEVDDYNADIVVIGDLDFDRLSAAIDESDFLKNINSLSWLFKQYDKIIGGYFKSVKIPECKGERKKSTRSSVKQAIKTRTYSKEEFDGLVDKIEDIEF